MVRISRAALTVVLLTSSLGVIPATAAASCAADGHPGGAWPAMNADLANTRHQADEVSIGPDEADQLTPAWTFSNEANLIAGPYQSTPIVAGGCVYAATSSGFVVALNADTGALVWAHVFPGAKLLAIGSGYGNVYVFPYGDAKGPRAAALDMSTGEVVWETERLVAPISEDGQKSEGQQPNLAPVVFDGMLFFSGSYAFGNVRVPLYFLDAHTGETIKRFSLISEEERAAGYGCCATWATPAVDDDANVLYLATADSESFRKQHPYNQSFVKIAADRSDLEALGTVLGSYRGTEERYIDDQLPPGVSFDDLPTCENGSEGKGPLPGTSTSSSTDCLEVDVDFGASPTLFTGPSGRQIIADVQKSGVLHAAYTADMSRAFAHALSAPGAVGNAATSAWDGTHLYATFNGGTMWSFDDEGGIAWAGHNLADATRYQPTSVANGVVYTITAGGFLLARDAATGVPVLHRQIAADAGATSCSAQGSGVAIARNTIYAPCESGAIVAYRVAA